MSLFCCALLCVLPSFAIILKRKRKLVVLLCQFSLCLVIVVWRFHTMPRVCLQIMILVFPDHTHLLCFSLSSAETTHRAHIKESDQTAHMRSLI